MTDGVLAFDQDGDLTNEVPFDSVGSESSFGESFSAALNLGFNQTPLTQLASTIDLFAAPDDGPMVSPEELNLEAPGLAQPFTYPISRRKADIILKRHREEARLAQVIASGDQGAFQTASNFVAMMIPQALDPLNHAAGYGASALLSSLARGSRIGKTLLAARQARDATTAGKALLGDIADGVLGNIAIEPLALVAQEQFKQDYTATDFFIGTMGGTIGFAGLRYVGNKYISKALKAGGEEADQVFRSMMGQFVTGKRVTVGPFAANSAKEIDGGIEVGIMAKVDLDRVDYVKATPENIGNRVMIFPRVNQGSGIEFDSKATLGLDLNKNGFDLTEGVDRANGAANRLYEGGPGSLVSTRLKPGSKVIDLDQRLPEDTHTAFIEEFNTAKRAGGDITADDIRGLTGKEVFDLIETRGNQGDIDDEVLELIAERLQREGVAGYIYTHDIENGIPVRPQNGMHVFNSADLEVIRTVESDGVNVPRPSVDESRELAKFADSSENSIFGQDPEEQANFRNAVDNPRADETPEEMQKFVDDQVNELVEKEQLGQADAEDIAIREQVTRLEEKAELEEQGFKSAFLCAKDGGEL